MTTAILLRAAAVLQLALCAGTSTSTSRHQHQPASTTSAGSLQLGQGPPPKKVALGDWRCCWGIESCAQATNASCPPAAAPGGGGLLPTAPYCELYAGCLGACSRPANRTLWCELAQRCPAGEKGCVDPPSGFDDPALRQRFRPPQQTPAQAAAMHKIYATAVQQSAAARPYALQYMASIRPSLDPALHHLSPAELLEMFTWEFQRLPVFHNAPLDAWDVDRIGVNDDTPLNITLENGHIQQPCERWVLGGPEALFSTILYGDMFSTHFDLKVRSLCDLTDSLQRASNCLLFNANNLLHASIGNFEYGGMTFVLDSRRLSGRMLVEPIDGGLMTMRQWQTWQFWAKKLFFQFGWNSWKIGTLYPPNFYHLIQPHEAENKLTNPSYTNLAPILNYWFTASAPFPTPSNSGGIFLNYFEVMTDNVSADTFSILLCKHC